MSSRDRSASAPPRRPRGSIVLRCGLIVALAQLASYLTLGIAAATIGGGPIRSAWATEASALMAGHHDVIRRAGEVEGLEGALRTARRLSGGPRRHEVVPASAVDWSTDRLGVPAARWRTIAETAESPVGSLSRVAWVTTIDLDDPAGPLAVFSVAEWPMPLLLGRDPGAVAIWIATRFGLAALVGAVVAVWLTRPVLRLQSSVARFSAGSLGTRPDRTLLDRDDEFGELAREIDAMSARIEALVGAHRELLDDVAHELRSPLARINVAVELAGRSSTDDVHLGRIRRESERLSEMVDRLLTLSSLEHAVDDPGVRVPVRLDRLIAELVADDDFEAAGSGRRVRLRSTPGRGVSVLGHAEMLRSAIENVIRNGIRHTADGSTVDVHLGVAGGRATIVIRDHGPGVPGDALDAIFRPFSRVEPDRSGDSGGTGLGLAIAERAIRAHAGRITARNHADGGLEVVIELPAAEVPDAGD